MDSFAHFPDGKQKLKGIEVELVWAWIWKFISMFLKSVLIRLNCSNSSYSALWGGQYSRDNVIKQSIWWSVLCTDGKFASLGIALMNPLSMFNTNGRHYLVVNSTVCCKSTKLINFFQQMRLSNYQFLWIFFKIYFVYI